MRVAFLAATLAAFAAFAPPVRATVTEPNGLVVPLDGMNNEVELYTFFSQRGEGLDWRLDASSTPATFSPLCQFQATYVLNQAGETLGLAWYNVIPGATQPPPTYVIVAAGSPVGTTIKSSDIKNDPAYLGGEIGFALVGAQTHYSEPKWNVVCSGCSAPGPWILSLSYKSTTIADGYYLAFEDGNVTSSSFANDGDFNDDVFLVTGVACSGAGAPCDTGKPGVCAAGLTDCDGSGVTCRQLEQPGGEKCNGVDDDCDGTVDDNPTDCAADEICDRGHCVKRCGAGEFACMGDKVCVSGYCVDPACASVTCPAGQLCTAGTCRAPCDGVVCPPPGVCRADTCVDPCAGVTCGAGEACDRGICVPSCACSPCGGGRTCAPSTGLCVDPACATVTCGGGTTCVAGACVDACSVATCPPGQICVSGGCTAAPVDAGAPSDGGGLLVDAGTPDAAPDAAAPEADASDEAGGARPRVAVADATDAASSCGCRLGSRSSSRGAVVAAAALAALAARRRARRPAREAVLRAAGSRRSLS